MHVSTIVGPQAKQILLSTCGGYCGPCARRHPGSGNRPAARSASHAHHSSRVRTRRRSGREQLCREPVAARRQRHWLFVFRIHSCCEMGWTPQGHRAERKVRSSTRC